MPTPKTAFIGHVYAPDTMQKLIRFGIKDIEHGSLIDEETARMMEDNDVCKRRPVKNKTCCI